jgi:type II secretory pathway component PulF
VIGADSAHLATFAKQFASMIAGGLQLVAVLEDLARETPHRPLRNAARDVARQVSAGVDLADALERHPRLFDGVFVGLVRSGLESGRLTLALGHVADHLHRVDQTKRKLASATMYPIFVLLTFCAASSGMMFFILPQYESMFSSFGRELPWPTRLLLDIGEVLRHWAPWILGPLVGAALAALVVVANARVRVGWDRMKLGLPILGPVWRLAALARFSRTLAVQTGNQVPVVRAVRLAAAAAGNRHLEQAAAGIADDVERGASVTAAFRQRALFSGLVLQMIAAGEQTGTLDELLTSAATYFDSLLTQRIEAATSLLNPILTAVLGSSVAGMMIAAFLPVFEMPGALQ